MYASPVHYNLCHFVVVVAQLQSIMIALHETWYNMKHPPLLNKIF